MSEPLLQQSLAVFLDQLASGAATPGGGSVAALSGACAAGLLAMVCNLSIGKKALADFEQEARSILEHAEQQRRLLQQLAQDDIEVFEHLMAAYGLPRATEADAATRRAAIQRMTRQATEVPLRTAQAIAALLPLCAPLARHGNRNAISDVGVAALLIQAAIPSALLNVNINLKSLEDQLFVREVAAQVENLSSGLANQVGEIMALVHERMGYA